MKFTLYIFFCATALFSSCNFDSVKPSSSGKPGELVIVVDSVVWKTAAGNVLRDSLMAAVPGLPQYEPFFTIVTIQPNLFKNLLQNHRNVLMIETGPVSGGKKYALTQKRNVWSEPQLVLNLRATESLDLHDAVLAMAETIKIQFLNEDRQRLTESYKNAATTPVSEELKSAMGIAIPFPADYFIAVKEPGYAWVRKETANTSTGLQIFRFPYSSDTAFTPASIIALRDSLCKKHIPGPLAGSYMVTDKNYPLSVSQVSLQGAYSIMVNGLWRTEGDFMGGPFITYLLLNKNKSELIFIDCYIYAPKFNKREYVRQLEAMVHAMTIG